MGVVAPGRLDGMEIRAASYGDTFGRPYGLDSDTGRLPENPWPETPRASTWAGYRYMPPAVGFSDSSGTPLGVSQSGSNEKGSYYAFNRTYDPSQGRWTTPDPAASPWGNLQDYVGSRPVGSSDPSGLQEAEDEEQANDPCDKLPFRPDDNVREKKTPNGRTRQTTPDNWINNLTDKCDDCGCDVKTITVDIYDCIGAGEASLKRYVARSSGIMLQCCVKVSLGDYHSEAASVKKGYCDKNKKFGGAKGHPDDGHINAIFLEETDKFIGGLGSTNRRVELRGNLGETLEGDPFFDTETISPDTGLAHEIGHAAGLTHREGVVLMNEVSKSKNWKLSKSECGKIREFAQ